MIEVTPIPRDYQGGWILNGIRIFGYSELWQEVKTGKDVVTLKVYARKDASAEPVLLYMSQTPRGWAL